MGYLVHTVQSRMSRLGLLRPRYPVCLCRVLSEIQYARHEILGGLRVRGHEILEFFLRFTVWLGWINGYGTL